MKRTLLKRYTPIHRSKPKPEVLTVHCDGREVINTRLERGRHEYKQRMWRMYLRQRSLCCLCGLYMIPDDVTFEHENGRGLGGSKRDDRIELPDGTWINGAAHYRCNGDKGSRRVEYQAFAKLPGQLKF